MRSVNRHQYQEGEKMGVVITETDSGTKKKLMRHLDKISKELPEAIAKELDEIWMRIWYDAIDRCPKITGALAASINVIEGTVGAGGGAGKMMSPRQVIGFLVGQDIFNRTITAGDVTVINFETKKSTAEYAQWVHEGHKMRDGRFWFGVPFLTDALAAHEAELMDAVNRAMKELKLTRRD